MLDKLDDTVFAKATHAYGKAKDVPGLLRRLLAGDPAERSAARFELGSALCHQGTLFPATALAVPHLLELVAEPKVKERAELLRLLADIVTLDDPVRFLVDGCPDDVPGDLPAAFKRSIAAVRKGAPAIGALLEDEDPRIRSAAAFLLAWLPRKKSAVQVSAALAAEKDEGVKVSLILALGYLDPNVTLADHLAAKSVTRATAAALALSTATKGNIGPEARALIVAAARRPALVVHGMMFAGGDLAAFAVRVLAALSTAETSDSAEVVDALVSAVEAGGAASMFAANVVARRLFEVKGPPPPPRHGVERRDREDARALGELPVKLGDLDATARRFVEALARLESELDRGLTTALGERGLPATKALMRNWLAGAEVPIDPLLDRAASFDGRASTLGELYIAATVARGEPRPEVLTAIEAATTPDERMELAWRGLEVVEVPWSPTVATELLWRNAPMASAASMAMVEELGQKGHVFAAAAGVALVSRARSAGTPPDEAADGLLQQARGYWPAVRRAVVELPIARRECWLLDKARDDRAQPANHFSGAWRYFDTCPTKAIADRALAHVATWKSKDPWGGDRREHADPLLKALVSAFRAAGNEADARRLEAAYQALPGRGG